MSGDLTVNSNPNHIQCSVRNICDVLINSGVKALVGAAFSLFLRGVVSANANVGVKVPEYSAAMKDSLD